MAIKISIFEAFQWFGEKAKEFTLSPIPDVERINIVLDRMRTAVGQKKLAYQEALKAVVSIQDPQRPDEGRLPHARKRLEEYENKGMAWGKELEHSSTSPSRKATLETLLQDLDTKVTAREGELKSLEAQLTTCNETLVLREKAYKKANADLKKLQQLAPTLIAQTDALKDSQRDRMAAAQASADSGDNPDQILKSLQEGLEEARAGDRAATIIEEDETSIDIDDVIAAQSVQAASSARINRWRGRSAS